MVKLKFSQKLQQVIFVAWVKLGRFHSKKGTVFVCVMATFCQNAEGTKNIHRPKNIVAVLIEL